MRTGIPIYKMKLKKKKHLENQKMVQEKGGFIYKKSKIMENLAKVLPLSASVST